ncbi:Hint domain-containing protein [uncultured Sulfitobacter sp.]|uniref:Hint domain-containing protein n=1 Tax=uncultured Sulfitobacter sp. TaxID=191468 RepID=UPI0026231D5B|nr:Hint domain-containing protein [uncultured Sulfitobacter sp.]
MPTYTFTGFSPSDLSLPSASEIRLTSTYDSTAAYTFEITDDDATWSGDSASNGTADDTSQQTTVVRDGNGAIVESGQSYLEYTKTAVDGYGNSIDIFRVMIGTTTVGYVANDQVVPGNTYDFVTTDITPSNEPAYTSIVDQTFDPDAENNMQGTVNDDYQRGYDGDDSLYGHDGDDTLEGWDGDDYVSGGAGNDTLYGWTGNDTVEGGDGDDSILGHGGNDSLSGDAGNDTLIGGAGADTIAGGTGDDSIHGDNDNDDIDGGDGNDSIDGGFGNDTIRGGAGNDTITGGGGQDLIIGGRGDDVMSAGNSSTTDTFLIRDGHGSDTILDFDPAEPDVLAFGMTEIQTYQDFRDRLSQDGPDTLVTYDNGQTTRLVNVDMADIGQQNFSTNTGAVCLHAGTLVHTPEGWRQVQDLRPGDLVITEGNRAEPIVAICAQRMTFPDRLDRGKPVLIKKDSFGPMRPMRDCIVSPQHRIALRAVSGATVLIAAAKLCGRHGVRRMYGRRKAQYHNILLGRHAVISAEGLPVESALLTAFTRKAFGRQAEHILEMGPAYPIVVKDDRLRLAFSRNDQPKHNRKTPCETGALYLLAD